MTVTTRPIEPHREAEVGLDSDLDLAELHRTLSPPKRRHRPQLLRALQELQALLEKPDETQHAFEVGYALDGDRFDRELLKILRYPTGRRLFVHQPSLLAAVSDREKLRALPEGTLGRAYLDHLERYGLDAEKLVTIRRETDRLHAARDGGQRWYVERSDLMHDFWHVLSGYGADGPGETALLLFSLAQRPTRSGLLLSFGATLRMFRAAGSRVLSMAWDAWRRGRAAVPLSALPYEELLDVPLDELRAALEIRPASSV